MTGMGREYGDGLYELARDEDLRPELHDALMEIYDCVKAQPAFERLLCSRAIERSERLKVVEETFGGRVHPYLVNFMKLLVEKERFDAFEDCAKWFHTRYNEDYGIVEAHVTSAIALSDERKQALKARLDEISGKNVTLICEVDPTVIGGIRVEMNGRRYDNTIQNRLDRLRHNLTESL